MNCTPFSVGSYSGSSSKSSLGSSSSCEPSSFSLGSSSGFSSYISSSSGSSSSIDSSLGSPSSIGSSFSPSSFSEFSPLSIAFPSSANSSPRGGESSSLAVGKRSYQRGPPTSNNLSDMLHSSPLAVSHTNNTFPRGGNHKPCGAAHLLCSAT